MTRIREEEEVLFVIKHFTKYTLCCRTHLTTLSHLLAVGGVTESIPKIVEPLLISATIGASNFKFGTQLGFWE